MTVVMKSVRRKFRRQAAASAACLFALSAAGAFAQNVPTTAPSVTPPPVIEKVVVTELPAGCEELIGQLSSSDFRVRQKATEQLLADERLELPMIERALSRGDLNAEARPRLLQVGRQLFMKTPRGAMGVQFGGNLRDRVIVGRTFEKFESSRLLEEGDMIVEAGGYKLDGPGGRFALQAMIVSRDPGDKLPVVVRRGPQRVAIDIPLGKFADLENTYIPEDRMQRAWRLRCRALTGERAEAVRLDIPPGAWNPAPEDQRRAELMMLRRQAIEGAPMVAGGGMARVAADMPDEARFVQQVQFINGRQRLVNVPIGRMFTDAEFEASLPPMTAKEELATLAEAKIKYQADLRNLPDPSTLTPNDNVHVVINERKKGLDLLDKQRQAIEAEVAEGNGGKQSAAESTDGRP